MNTIYLLQFHFQIHPWLPILKGVKQEEEEIEMMEKGKEEEVEVKKSREKKVEENKAQENMVEEKKEEEKNKLEGKTEHDNSEKTSNNKVEKIKTEANTESRGINIIHHHRKKYGNFISISYNFLTGQVHVQFSSPKSPPSPYLNPNLVNALVKLRFS